MIFTIVTILFLLGLLLCLVLRWRGLLVAVVSVVLFLAAYGYATVPLFLPNDFYLLAIYGNNHVWIEEKSGEPRTFYMRSVPEEWREAMEKGEGQPIRIKTTSEANLLKQYGQPWTWLDAHEGMRVIEDYRMTKQ